MHLTGKVSKTLCIIFNIGLQCITVIHAITEVEVTVGHRLISVHIAQMTPQQQLCGHCVQTHPIAIAVCIVVPQIASGGVVYIRVTTC